MANYEHKGQLTKIDENGDKHILFPETEIDCVHGLNAALSGKVPKSHAEDKNNPHNVTAEQVGARPDTWMPTASDVGARSNNWLPTPTEIGVAPAQESTSYPGCFYRTVNGEAEWINPPMVAGEEYRTTERWNGKPVYIALLNFEKLPSATRGKVYANITESSNYQIIGTPVAVLSTGAVINGVGYDYAEHSSGSHIMVTGAVSEVAINTDYDASGVSAQVLVKSVHD